MKIICKFTKVQQYLSGAQFLNANFTIQHGGHIFMRVD
jgi:hypothetical protein